jgi:2-amino-4-hydroxy-6-hydroxymethyldihydropteridine diphosphokinase
VNQVWLGVGSNCQAVDNVSACLDALLLQFHDLNLSSVFESEAAGLPGHFYLNLVVGLQTAWSLSQLSSFLKNLERKQGRSEQVSQQVPLDVDILLFNNLAGNFDGITLPRPEILTAPYVLCPLAQVAGKLKHPTSRVSYRELWDAFDLQEGDLRAVDFSWHGRIISNRGKVRQ